MSLEGIKDFGRGYKTIVYSVALMLAGLGEYLDIITLLSPESAGLVLFLSGLGTLILRYLTNTPIATSEMIKVVNGFKSTEQLNNDDNQKQ